ncbi:MAG: uracil-DNA glycosylase [Bacillota bacterium]
MAWGEGNPAARLILVIDNPGLKWDREGHPFVYGTRQVLRRLLGEAGLDVTQCYLTPLIKCKPRPRKPQSVEAARACFPYFVSQFEKLRPGLQAGVSFGGLAAEALFEDAFQEAGGIYSFRGHWRKWRGVPFMPTYHPYVAFRSPHLLRFIARDLAEVARVLNSNVVSAVEGRPDALRPGDPGWV